MVPSPRTRPLTPAVRNSPPPRPQAPLARRESQDSRRSRPVLLASVRFPKSRLCLHRHSPVVTCSRHAQWPRLGLVGIDLPRHPPLVHLSTPNRRSPRLRFRVRSRWGVPLLLRAVRQQSAKASAC
eukprot:scaffold280027_cov30-Tisochrysis_lutea.AAC.3